MLAERYVLRTDVEGRLAGLPVFPPNEEVEVIVLRKERQTSRPRNQRSATGFATPSLTFVCATMPV